MTKKHQKNEQKMSKMSKMSTKKNNINTDLNQKNQNLSDENQHFLCKFCGKNFKRIFNLRRHESVCNLNNNSKKIQNIPRNSKNEQKKNTKNEFCCFYCHKNYSSQSNLTRHEKKCYQRDQHYLKKNAELKSQLQEKTQANQLLLKDLQKEQALNKQQQEMIKIAKNSKQIINNHTTHNKTINYLNSHYGDMISMEKFLYNLENTEQLTHHERELLLMAFKENGIELFARSFSQIMKENCKRQLIKEGVAEMHILPLYCSDSNLRSHKEKEEQGWKTHYDNTSLNKMISISTDQVYESHRQPLVIIGRHRDKVFKQVKKDNHSQTEKIPLLIDTEKNE